MAVTVHTSRNHDDFHSTGEYFQVTRPEGVLYVFGGKDSRGDDLCIAAYAASSWNSAKVTSSS